MLNDKRLKKTRRKLRRGQTDAEKKLWRKLRNKQIGKYKFFRQYSINKYIVDFYCPKKKLAVEVDGGGHAEDKNKLNDKIRTDFLNNKGIKVIRFWNIDIYNNLEGVLIEIRRNLGIQ